MGDMTGGSFTISNSGLWGSLFGTPIINVPQTAVLGTYGIQDRPVAINGQVKVRPVSIIQSPFISCFHLIILPTSDDVHCSDLRSPPC
jgi:pyruvate/2-oxoglutarate dehydrogenase complex dihydrolipoamide acyltransferase (E2) component